MTEEVAHMQTRWISGMMLWAFLCTAVVDAQFSSAALCAIPYGTANNQISLAQGADQPEGDFADSEYPLLLRRLHTGEFLIVSKRKSGLFVQVFNSSGQLQRSYECSESLGDIYSLDVDRRGKLYCLRYLEGRDLSTHKNKILSIYDDKGKSIPIENSMGAVLEKLKSVRFDFPILDLVVDKNGTIYIPISARPDKDEKSDNMPILVCFSPDNLSIDTATMPGYPTLTPKGDIVFLNFAPIEVAEEQCLRHDGAKARLIKMDKSLIGEFTLSNIEVYYPSMAFAISPDYLGLVDIKGVIDDKKYPLQRRQFTIIDRQGHQVFTTELLVPLGARRLWDIDEMGNIYYLNCDENGVEIRRITIANR